MSPPTPEVTSGSDQHDAEPKGLWGKLGIFSRDKDENDYEKLYGQVKKRAADLEKRLDQNHVAVVKVASDLRSGRLKEVFPKNYSQNYAQAVQALLNECQLSLKERQRLEGVIEQCRKTTRDLEIEHNKLIEQRAIDVSQLEDEKEQLKANHEKRMALAVADLQSEINRLNAVILQKEREHNYKIHQVKKDQDEKTSEMEMEFAMERSKLLSDHTEQQGRLKKDIEALNGALVKRDHFKPLSDHELKIRFSDLTTDIDHLARLGWKYNHTDWTDELLGQTKNPRKIKKNILLESLWSVLYDSIFCSPFRVLGEEGRSLETDWNVAFGRDSQPEKGSYSWPKASLDSERWRYETIKKCQEAVAQPISEWDPRYKLKSGFEKSLDKIKGELSETIRMVSDLDGDTVKALEDVARQAAKMWLEFNTQRCRILVDMSGSSLKLPSSDRVKRLRGNSLIMVVVPPLQRFGNSKGQDLHKEEKIAGCEGATELVVMGNSG